MSTRSYKQFAILLGGSPQPLVGTFITATTAPNPPANPDGSSITTLPVSDSSMLMGGEDVFICSPTFTNPERTRVFKVVDGTHIQVKGLRFTRTGGAVGTGDWISVGALVNSVYVQSLAGNAGLLYLGNQGLNKTGLVHVVTTMFNVTTGQPTDFTDIRRGAPDSTDACDWWIDGTTNDKYQASFGIN